MDLVLFGNIFNDVNFREKQFCEVQFALKVSGFLFLACSLMFASNLDDDETFVFDELMSASSPFDF